MEEWERWERRVQTAAHPVVYRLLTAVAARGPVVRVPGVGVVVSDARTAREVLTDTEAFTKTGPGAAAQLWTPVLGARTLITLDGADHAALRRRLSGLFTPAQVGAVCERGLREPLAGATRRLAAGDEVDLVPVVRAGAGAVIRELVGLPPDAAAGFAEASAVLAGVRLWRASLTGRQTARARAALARLSEAAVAAYRSGDESTVPGRLRGLGLSEAEARGAVGMFLLTGTETLVSFVPRLIALAHDVGRGPDRITDAVVEEALRVTSPTPVMLRSAARNGRLAGVRVRAGDRVVVAGLLCTRSAGPFAPDSPARAPLNRLWFGAGPHFCLGMPLAMAEIATVLTALRPFPALTVTTRHPARGVLIPSYTTLAVRATPPAKSPRASGAPGPAVAPDRT
ncbi:cytochrome P450 [Streptomyces antimicrobicus]|uniref:Cytochrome P450 n=1 Tax=Streptomyces antimicrobicus TaxID=2883108 RepID=A0ABS8BE67_9ACTN|nr:cytochrome P450 [Streptomyces antimicrobicus]MCB5182939.1 cytochrome P450 [Streptomyces antimicrobicus]